MKRSIQINGISGLCVTKLDVLDGVETLRLGVGYKWTGNGEGEQFREILPVGAEELACCDPVYEEMPGMDRQHGGDQEFQSATFGSAQVSEAHGRGLRGAGRHDIDRTGPGTNDCATASICLT